MSSIIGRNREKKKLAAIVHSEKSEFVAVFGRRRVGKTFLIREYFNNQFEFYHTGLANANTEQQLVNFHNSLIRQCDSYNGGVPENWLSAFQSLINHLEEIKTNKKKIIFFDELPWLDTPKSDFLIAFEHFWNGYLSCRKDIILITCGSAAAWMINELINSTGGLHNRVTQRMKIEPFNLNETEALLRKKGNVLDRYQIIQLYMAMGGIPFYIENISSSLSAPQNIEQMAFVKGAILQNEYLNLLKSLFRYPENHDTIIKALSTKAMGMTRDEIVSTTGLSSGGGLSKTINELDESGFISAYSPFSNKKKQTIYRLSDHYCLFYHRFIQNNTNFDTGIWVTAIDNPSQRAWSGYAFEQICLSHTEQIKKALGISGIQSSVSSWVSSHSSPGAQIDLLIDRRDQTVTICEAKFSINQFEINKSYAEKLRNKIGVFRSETHTKKAVLLAMITTYGVKTNAYSGTVMQNSITMDDLFAPL